MATYKSKRPYTYGTGRRKSSVARVHLIPGGTGAITVNGRSHRRVFRT
jgi:small subunit ribosomal protein S9